MKSRQYMEAQLVVVQGGHLTEKLDYSKNGVATDASNNIQQVAIIAGKMVKLWGMSEKIEPVMIDDGSGQGNQLIQMMERRNMWGSKINNTNAADCVESASPYVTLFGRKNPWNEP